MGITFNPFTGTLDFTGGAGGGGGTPVAPDTSVQFNNSGAFGGSSGFIFDQATDSVQMLGHLAVGLDALIDPTTLVSAAETMTTASSVNAMKAQIIWEPVGNNSSVVRGIYGTIVESGDKNTAQVIGIDVQTQHTSSGTTDTVKGLALETSADGGDVTVGVVGIDNRIQYGSGTIPFGAAEYIRSPQVSFGTVTTNYGILIEDQSVLGATNYAIKTGLGLVHIGDSAIPTTSVLFSDAGDVAGHAALTWDKTANILRPTTLGWSGSFSSDETISSGITDLGDPGLLFDDAGYGQVSWQFLQPSSIVSRGNFSLAAFVAGDANGRVIALVSGNGTANGGSLTLTGGNGAAGNGGNITLVPGTGTGGINGKILLQKETQAAADITLTNGVALKSDTNTAHTALLQAYDVDGAAYKTFATLTNGNTPDFTIAPPAGGSVSLSANVFIGNTGYYEGTEMTAPAAGAANTFRLFAQDNGGGKTQLMILFATGAAQQLAVQA